MLSWRVHNGKIYCSSNRLVGEAAEVSQLDSRQVQLHFEEHQMKEAVDTALQNSQQGLRRHAVEVSIPANLPAVRMDLERITEVIVHLLDNAGKYSPPDTPIHVTVELCSSTIALAIASPIPVPWIVIR